MNTPATNQRGGALLITLAIMTMLTIGAILAVNTAQTDIDLSFNQLHADQAFYVAEAGLTQSFMQLKADNDWNDGFVNVAFEDGLYSVAVIDSFDQEELVDTVILRATGSRGEANANIEAMVVPEYQRPFDFAMLSTVNLTMTNSACTDSYNSDSGSYDSTVSLTDGDIASNGTIDLINSADVGGDVSAVVEDGIDLCATCTVHGDTTTGVEPYPIEPVADSLFTWAQTVTAAPGGLSGDYNYNFANHDLNIENNDTASMASGVYYFRNIDVGNNAVLLLDSGAQVTIYLDGNFTSGQTSVINPDGAPADLLIYASGGTLVLGESTEMRAAFYGPETDVYLDNSNEFYGAIISRRADLLNSACVHYDRSLSDFQEYKTGEMIMIAWKEL